jgi:hypothetical protein
MVVATMRHKTPELKSSLKTQKDTNLYSTTIKPIKVSKPLNCFMVF